MEIEEDNVQLAISEWIQNKVNANVYWARNPADGFGRFKFTGNRIPNLLVNPMADNGLTICVELVDGNNSAHVHDSMIRLHHQWRQYEYGDATVTVDDDEIEIDAFVIGNRHSPNGRLFKYDPNDDGLDGDDREKGFRRTYTLPTEGKRKEGAEKRPQYSYARSEHIPSTIARFARYEAERQEGDEYAMNAGVGVLLSNVLNEDPSQPRLKNLGDSDEITTLPYIHWYNGEGYNGDKNPLWTEL